MQALLEMLMGGDQRSIGRSNEVADLIHREPELFDIVFDGMHSDDPLLRMRCADVAEKVTALRPEYLVPHKRALLETLSKIDQHAVRWHVATMIARLPISRAELAEAAEILTGYLSDSSSIVRTSALQALYDLATRNDSLWPVALRHIDEALLNGTPAMKARCKRLLTSAAIPPRD